MILVLLGTQDKSFKRLLEAIDDCCNRGLITDRVVVQAGYTKFQSKNLEIFKLISVEEFNALIKEADLVISHGGVGSIITALKEGKKLIVAPRLSEFLEHTNDHQLDIVNNFTKEGYILPLLKMDELGERLLEVADFKPKTYQSNTKEMVKLIKDFIDRN